METSKGLPELVAAARTAAKASEDQISEIMENMRGPNGSDDQKKDLAAATLALELIAVDTFTLFEARMQHHFKRGPFSRKLRAELLKVGHADLADRIHKFYLAINVLKHGKGASYRELLNAPTSLFAVRPAGDDDAASALIDVRAPGFFDGLTAAILEAYDFLEN
ncbi:MAG: hypothetical protein ACI86S_000875 [Paracoccaceae bacterium]|jgi:hypothetical protein